MEFQERAAILRRRLGSRVAGAILGVEPDVMTQMALNTHYVPAPNAPASFFPDYSVEPGTGNSFDLTTDVEWTYLDVPWDVEEADPLPPWVSVDSDDSSKIVFNEPGVHILQVIVDAGGDDIPEPVEPAWVPGTRRATMNLQGTAAGPLDMALHFFQSMRESNTGIVRVEEAGEYLQLHFTRGQGCKYLQVEAAIVKLS